MEREIAAFCRVFRYDRARRGGSSAATGLRDAIALVTELNALLMAVGVPGPYLLVGQSLGGILMRVFAEKHGHDVAGLVLAESMHASQFDVLGPAFPPPRLHDSPVLAGMRGFWTGGYRRPEANVEHIDMLKLLAQDRSIVSLGDLPLHVLTAGAFLSAPFLPAEEGANLQRLWEGLQTDLLRLSPRSVQTFRRQSGHFVQRDDPASVVAAIRDVYERRQVR